MSFKQSLFYQILKKLGITRVVLFFVCRWNDFTRAILYKVIHRTRDVILTINCCVYCMLVRKSPLVMHREVPLIVSLTSYPARINTTFLALYSLLRQRVKPDKIILWLAKEEFGSSTKLPFMLRLLSTRGITVQWVEKNYKVYNKFLSSYHVYPHATIVVCDDDAIYLRWWLKHLYEAHLETPECIVGHRGYILSKSSPHTLNSYGFFMAELQRDIKNKDTEKYQDPSIAIFLEGVGGILFPPHTLPAEVDNYELFEQLSPSADDVWLNAMAMYKGTPRRVTYKSRMSFGVIMGTQGVGLYKTNLLKGKNDVQLKQVFDYFDLYKLVSFYI